MEQSQESEVKEAVEKLLKDARSHIPLISYRSRYDSYKLTATAKQLVTDLQSRNFKNVRNLIKDIDLSIYEDDKLSLVQKQKLFNEHKKVVLDEIDYLLFYLKNTP
jgi:hypothetical protein